MRAAKLHRHTELIGSSLVIVDQHPSKGREPDDDGERDRPYADADVADGLPGAFVLGNLAMALPAFAGRVRHGLPSCREMPGSQPNPKAFSSEACPRT